MSRKESTPVASILLVLNKSLSLGSARNCHPREEKSDPEAAVYMAAMRLITWLDGDKVADETLDLV